MPSLNDIEDQQKDQMLYVVVKNVASLTKKRDDKNGLKKQKTKKFQLSIKYFQWQSKRFIILQLVHKKTKIEDIIIKKQELSSIQVLKSISHEFGTQINIMRQIIDHRQGSNLSSATDKQQSLEKDLNKEDEQVFSDLSNNLFILQIIFQDFLCLNNCLLLNQIIFCLKNFNLYFLFAETVTLFQRKCQLKQIDLKLIIDGDVPQYINQDSHKIKSILANLLQNSIKFSDGGNILVFVKIVKISNVNFIKIFVEDEGVGMTPEEMMILRKKLKDLDLSNQVSQNSSGSGFGLIISNIFQQIINNNRESFIEFDSSPEGKTFFSFIIRLNYDQLEEEQIVVQFKQNHKDNEGQKIHSQKFKRISIFKKNFHLSSAKLIQKKVQNSIIIQREIEQDFVNLEQNKKNSSQELSSSQGSIELQINEQQPQFYFKKSIVNILIEKQNNFQQLFDFQGKQFKKGYYRDNKFEQMASLKIIPYSEMDSVIPDSEIQSHNSEYEEFKQNKNTLNCLNINLTLNFNSQDQKRQRILLVDDEPMNIYYVQQHLERYGFKYLIDVACNGEIAVEKVVQSQKYINLTNQYQGVIYKVILMDLNMPKLNGFQSAKQIFELYENGQYPIKPYIIAYSAYSEDNEIQMKCQKIGMHDFIKKPSSMIKILSTIQSFYDL